MNTILDQIAETKRQEVAALRPRADELKALARQNRRDFLGALTGREPVALIAEIKRASPSAGLICADFDPVRIAQQYHHAGAAALSVLTDRQFFQGDLDFLRQVRAAVPLPLLRKDFIIDELQVYESAAAGADAILLIAAMLDVIRLNALHALAGTLGLAVLVEVHNERELERALTVHPRLIGVNNRDLHDFSVDLATTEHLAPRLPATTLLVAESGLHTRADVERVARAGAKAILVGESLMRSSDIAGKVKELLG